MQCVFVQKMLANGIFVKKAALGVIILITGAREAIMASKEKEICNKFENKLFNTLLQELRRAINIQMITVAHKW